MAFRLIVVSSSVSVPDEAGIIASLFRSGLRIFHLRKPGQKKQVLKKLLVSIPEKYRSRIVIHSHYDLVNEFRLGGIHLPRKVRDTGRVKRVKGKVFSTSFHLHGDALNADLYDYFFLSPVFNSISKRGHNGPVEFGVLKKFLGKNKKLGQKVIALGGVNEKNILKVKRAGFGGAATLGAIWESKDPVKAFLKIRSKID